MVSLDSVGSTRSSKYITSYDCYKRNKIAGAPANNPLREKCPNGGLFLVRIFPHLDISLIQSKCGKIRTRENSVFGHLSRSYHFRIDNYNLGFF